jgi:hypothetical protein
MKEHFPNKILQLKPFKGPFKAFKLEGLDCDTYFASYTAGTIIKSHDHDTDNCGVITKGELILKTQGKEQHYQVGDWYFIPAGQEHSARFIVDTAEVEFWFKK